MNKEAMMRAFDNLNTRRLRLENAMQVALAAEESRQFDDALPGDVSVGLSSGTSGNRGLFAVSRRERALWVAAVLAKVLGWSWKPRKVAFFLRANNKLYQSVRSRLLSFHYFDLLEPFDPLLERIADLQPDIVVAQPSVLRQLALAVQQKRICINPSKIISVAEVLNPEVKDLVETVFSLQVNEVYQCTEGFLASSCSAGNLHFHEDLLMVEQQWLDADKRRFFPVITDFTRRVQPMVNYTLNDVVHLRKEPCPCGSPYLCIEKIEGRADDMLVFERLDGGAVLVFPDWIRRIMLMHVPQATHYQIEQNAANMLFCWLDGDQAADLFLAFKGALANWCTNQELKMPELHFSGPVPFNPTRKFRVISRSADLPAAGLPLL
jgi:putative adenylate-forming enzyme